jgi:ABC-type multidrug transport system fused ATPase/permease subunit
MAGHILAFVFAVIIMARINLLITAVIFVPLAGTFVITRLAWARYLHYGRASRLATDAVTGFLGELFGAVQVELVPAEPPQVLVAYHPLWERSARGESPQPDEGAEWQPLLPSWGQDIACPYILRRDRADRLEMLDVRGLSYRHVDTENGIFDIDLSLRRGSFTVITGRIGAGKTTLLRALLGLLPRDAGEISWNGLPIADAAAWFRAPRCAYTPQVPRLFSDTLRNNILLGLPEGAVDLAGAIRMGVLEQDIAALEHGLDTLVGPRGVRLSGGQVQRAAAARMFVRAPELLVFDDLSSALDVETERTLWERLDQRPTTNDQRPTTDWQPLTRRQGDTETGRERSRITHHVSRN